ncbi:glycosyltransferase family 1 protein [Demequina capsici]|uniref:Glycosyltransferase family 1 protein n=1 Tax=Demequina capsici TaxID=3075620 RepID=A0AA96FD96_9MICO|nr:glycosyltransferase family 1 protein [Demequina sp. PMTSA13]WNM27803.1 glycosyltransferase family 1 protein [Demequina sp. PMTSA13]
MRVAIDAIWWLDGPPSGRNIVRDLARAWVNAFPDDEITLYVQPRAADSARSELPSARIVESSAQRLPHALLVRGMRALGRDVDVVISNNFGIGAVDAFSIVILYDTIFVRHPEWFSAKERLYLSRIRRSLRHTDRVVTGAESEVVATLAVWPELEHRMVATDYGVPRELVESTALPVHGIAKPFVLSVGRFNVRKNLTRLVEAFGRSRIGATHELVIVGPRDGLPPALAADPNVERSVVMPGAVSPGELRWLYENAAALAFPTLDEGYGLPMIEAAAFGLPVIASDIPALREVGVSARSFDPLSVDEIVEALNGVPELSRTSASEPRGWAQVVANIRETVVAGG